MITITIQGYGTFQISSEKMQELLNWLSSNNGVRTQNNENLNDLKNKIFQGKDLING